MTLQEFRAALECWQLEVITLCPSRESSDFWDIEVRYGAFHYKHRFDRYMLHRGTADDIALQTFGACYDCGSRPIHPNVKSRGGTMCRECTIKGGAASDFRHTFDLDKLRARVGAAELRMLIQTCTWEGPRE